MWQRTSFARFAGSTGTLGLLLLAVGLLAGCPGPHLMPTPNVDVQTQAQPFADVAPPLRTNTVDGLHATDRQPVLRDDGTLAYGSGRSFALAVGSCVVEMGQDVAWDTLVQQSQQAERTQELPLRIRALTEQIKFPATPMPFVLAQRPGHGGPGRPGGARAGRGAGAPGPPPAPGADSTQGGLCLY